MRCLAITILAALALLSPCAPALGQGDAQQRPAHGPLWLDATAYGVSTRSADNTAALQRAVDKAQAAVATAIAADSSRAPLATVFIPGDKSAYYFKDPVYVDGSCVRILGEGRAALQGTKLTKVVGYGSPVFVVGLSRTSGGVLPNATYRPDLNGKVDASVVTGANQRWGLRTNGDLIAMSVGSALTHGGFSLANRTQADYWQECDYLTVDAIVEGFSAGALPLAYVGCGNGPASPVPFVLSSTGAGAFSLIVGYQAAKFAPVTTTTHTFSAPGATGVVRVSAQIDLVNRAVTAFVNGVQVAVSGGTPPAGARFPEPGTAPKDNIHGFFLNAQYNLASDNRGSADLALYGFSVSKTLKYANRGADAAQTPNPQICNSILTIPGTPTGGTFTITYKGQTTGPIPWNASAATIDAALEQLSTVGVGNVAVSGSAFQFAVVGSNGVDFSNLPSGCDGSNLTGVTVADAYRCFASVVNQGTPAKVDQYDVAHFVFNENPSTGTRHLSLSGQQAVGGRTSSVFLLNGHTLDATASQVHLEGLEIAADQGYGAGVLRAHVLEQHFDDCKISGGLWGVADAIYGGNYNNFFRNCSVTGYDAGVNLYRALTWMDTTTVGNNGRWAYRLTGCNMDSRVGFVTAVGSPQYGFARICASEYGGTYIFDSWTLDNEGQDYALASFYAERHSSASVQLTVTNSYLGFPGSSEMFMLRDLSTTPLHAVMTADFIAADVMGNLVNVDGPGWQFRVTRTGSDGGSDVYNVGTYPGNPRGIVEGTAKLPVRYGQSWAGSSILTNPGPTDGQFATLRPASGGAWGSATPARWRGSSPLLADDTASLAAYAVDHTAFGCTLSGHPSTFGYSTSTPNPLDPRNTAPGAAPGVANTLFGGTILGTSATLRLGGTGLGGTFTLSYGGQTTGPIAFNAPATGTGSVQTALQGLSSVGAGNMTVAGNAGGPWTIALAGAKARLAGGILGLTVDGSSLTATGATAALTGSYLTLAGAAGGTFTITYNGKTTAALPYNATSAQIKAAMFALNTGFSSFAYCLGGPGGPWEVHPAPASVAAAGLTAAGGTATLTPTDVPQTWYVTLLGTPGTYGTATTTARKRNFPLNELKASVCGIYRRPLANTPAGFAAASSGTKASAAAVVFPAATAVSTVTAVGLADAPIGGNLWSVMELATPLSVAIGDTPTINVGGITVANVPAGGSFGGLSDYGWTKVYDCMYGGTPFAVPSAYYAALSTAKMTRASASPTEPSGNNYARVAITADAAHFKVTPDYGQAGDVNNVLPIAFPTPSAPWGTAVSLPLMDAPSGGNPWLYAPLTAPIATSTAAPTVAPGSLLLGF